ncbi:MAG: LysM peptidoglycan-binding domain-containing protein, partial [Gemmatimonadota bacterium]
AIGNTHGVGQVDDQMEIVEAAAAAQLYTVVRGDSLSKIAKEFYGDYKQYPAIFEANRPMLEHPDKIYPGQVLRIPALG